MHGADKATLPEPFDLAMEFSPVLSLATVKFQLNESTSIHSAMQSVDTPRTFILPSLIKSLNR